MRPALPNRLAAIWRDRPLAVVVVLALALRLLAAFLSRGFAFSDDHFEVVEPAQRWVEGHYDLLFRTDTLRGLVYPGAHWAVFLAARALGIADPQVRMLVVRLLDGAWSMIVVVYGYRIAEKVAGRERARWAGLLLAAFWIAPFAAVRDLVEVACQPPLVLAIWALVRREEGPGRRDALVAGLWLGLAFSIRFQTAVVAGGLGLVLLAQRRVRAAVSLGVGAALSAAVLVGALDWIFYGRPFSSAIAYFRFNADPANVAQFPVGPWYQPAATLLGALLPPASLLLAWGAIRARRVPLVFWPAVLFLVAHSLYPGKQERFLLPVLPLVLVLAAIGTAWLLEESPFWRRHRTLARGLLAWFWIVNAPLLALYLCNYSKRTRVEPLSFLHAAGDARAVVVETSEPEAPLVPVFYLGDRAQVFTLPAGREVEDLRAELAARGVPRPDYVIFTGAPQLEAREARLAPICPRLGPVRTFEPGAVDRLLHRMNPRHNVNLTARLFRCE